MVRYLNIRTFAGVTAGFITALAWALTPVAALAQSGAPIKIGYAISQTGGLAGGGNSALLAQKIWGRPSMPKGACSADLSSSFITTIRAVRPRFPVSIRSCWISITWTW